LSRRHSDGQASLRRFGSWCAHQQWARCFRHLTDGCPGRVAARRRSAAYEVEGAAHRGGRDISDLLVRTHFGCEQVDDLAVDQGRRQTSPPFGRTDFLDGDIERSRLRPCKQALSVCAACLGSAVRSVSWHASGTLRTSCPIDLGVSARERPGRGTQCACHGPLTHGVPPSQCSFTRGPTLGHRDDDEAVLCQRREYRSICCIHRRKHPLMITGRRCGKVLQVRISRQLVDDRDVTIPFVNRDRNRCAARRRPLRRAGRAVTRPRENEVQIRAFQRRTLRTHRRYPVVAIT